MMSSPSFIRPIFPLSAPLLSGSVRPLLSSSRRASGVKRPTENLYRFDTRADDRDDLCRRANRRGGGRGPTRACVCCHVSPSTGELTGGAQAATVVTITPETVHPRRRRCRRKICRPRRDSCPLTTPKLVQR